MLPNFIGIGAQRCATSWLYFCLREHPQIYLPYLKEIAFFNRFYDNGIQWYERYFNQRTNQKAVGEITPSYLFLEKTAERIARHLPGVKLIVTLRNPIDRAYSQYRKHVRAGVVRVDFETALEKNPEYIRRGFYHEQLSRYLTHFPKESMLILLYEDIEISPDAELRKVFRFLEVDESFTPREARTVIPSEALGGGAKAPVSKIASFLRRKGFGAAIDAVKRTPVLPVADRIFHRFNGPKMPAVVQKEKPETIDAVLREKLRRIFKDEIRRTSELLKRDLSWN